MLAVLAAIVTFAAVVLGGYWLALRGNTAEARVLSLRRGEPGQGNAGRSGDGPGRGRGGSVGRLMGGLLPSRMVSRTEARLDRAGKPLDAGAFYLLVVTLAVALPAVFIGFIWLVSGKTPSGVVLVLSVTVGVLLGGWLPFRWLRWRVNGRRSLMRKRLPDALDLLTLCVEAGLGLDASFRRVSDEMEGPFSEEIRTMLDEVGLGKPRRQALLDMAARCGIPEADVTVNAVIQSQQMGSSLASTLRAQAQQLRGRRRQRAEELARQAGVKMAFPLVLCLMPSLFIVVLGPIAVNLVRTLGK